MQPAALRRTDMQGSDQPLDLAATNHAWSSSYGGPLLSGTIRSVLTGSVWTEDRRFRLAPSGACAHCPAAPLETPDHLFWDCPAWDAVRAGFPELNAPVCASAAWSRWTSARPQQPAESWRSACRPCTPACSWPGSAKKGITPLALRVRAPPSSPRRPPGPQPAHLPRGFGHLPGPL